MFDKRGRGTVILQFESKSSVRTTSLDFGLVGVKMIIRRVVFGVVFRFVVAWQLVSLSNLTFAQSPTTNAAESSILRTTNRIVENADQPSLARQSINTIEATKKPEIVVEKNLEIDHEIDETFIETIDLGNIIPGTTVVVALNMKNALAESFSLDSAKVGCSCMSATIPKVSIAPGKAERLEFKFTTKQLEPSPTKQIDVVIGCNGSLKRLVINFTSTMTGVISFSEQSLVIEKGEKSLRGETIVEKKISIYVPTSTLPADLLVRAEGEADSLIKPEIIWDKGKPSLLLRIKTDKEMLGKVVVYGKVFKEKTIDVCVRSQPELEIRPLLLIFGSNSELAVSATSIIRIGREMLKGSEGDIVINLKTSTNESFAVDSKEIRPGLFRVDFSIAKQKVESLRNKKDIIRLTVRSKEREFTTTAAAKFLW